MAEPAAAVAASAVNEARDLADLLSQRSPGTRTQAELTKHARIAAKPRIQPKGAPHGPAPELPKTAELVDLLSPPLAPVGVASGDLPAPIAPTPTLNAVLASVPVIASFTPPGGDGPARFPTSEPRVAIPPTSAVPEPGTWAMMLMGFGLVAWQVRRRRTFSAKTVRRAAN